MRIAFLTEASTNIGYGHLYRSIALAQEFISNKYEVDFYCNGNLPEQIIKETLIKIIVFESTEFKSFFQNYSLAVIDVYKNSWTNYQWITQLSGIKTASIIDYAFKEFAISTDYIFQIGFQEYGFKETIKQNENWNISKIYSGNDFFIFREEFKKVRTFEVKENAQRILVSMGGSDPYKLTEQVSKALEIFDNSLKINYIFGAGFSENRIKKINKIHKNTIHQIIFHKNTNNIANIMNKIDLAIINGGNTRFELALLGIPFLSIAINNSQYDISKKISTAGIGEVLGISSHLNIKKISFKINEYLQDFPKRKKMSQQMKYTFRLSTNSKIVKILTNKQL
ncbi:MAG: hypothetical protein K9H26_16445 [Prolixibacteraceae bacterium]|nr:hypothetical protein [Prolixibacteraceae bacterium]